MGDAGFKKRRTGCKPRRMADMSGGRITLRLAGVDGEHARYSGVAEDTRGAHPFEATVRVSDGAVQIAASPDPDATWMTALSKATLRAAFRGVQAGGPWPRRLSRWREAPDEK